MRSRRSLTPEASVSSQAAPPRPNLRVRLALQAPVELALPEPAPGQMRVCIHESRDSRLAAPVEDRLAPRGRLPEPPDELGVGARERHAALLEAERRVLHAPENSLGR